MLLGKKKKEREREKSERQGDKEITMKLMQLISTKLLLPMTTPGNDNARTGTQPPHGRLMSLPSGSTNLTKVWMEGERGLLFI